MNDSSPRVLIIHDDLSLNDPLIVTLQERIGVDAIMLEKKSSRGLEFIRSHLGNKLIVLLDLDLGAGEPDGVKVLESIRESTSLIYVVILTAKEFSSIPPESLVKIINNDAMALVKSTEDTDVIIAHIESALHRLEARVDCVIEYWLSKHKTEELNKPYLLRGGVSYSLGDLAREIRKATPVGKEVERMIVQMAVKMFFDKSS